MASFQELLEMDRRLGAIDETLGEGAESDENISNFKDWLLNNGARFDKIDWPSTETASGMRGAVAKEDIETNETMLYIPAKLMISPLSAFSDPVMGDLFKNTRDVLRGDFLLTMFLSYEISKGEDSFWYPYLRILPIPGSISYWNTKDLNELQDVRITHRAMNKRATLEAAYISIMKSLQQRYSDLVSYDIFTYPRFLFSFNTIQARAFGRRLPWTALVPFADCLNHTNVQTKYDYNIEDNHTFRLFPTGLNSYRQGTEVFNSYGRRANDNLLLDYGFALPENEWEEVTFHWKIPTPDQIGYQRLQISRAHRFSPLHRIVLHQRELPLANIPYFRIAALTESELESLSQETKHSFDQPLSLENEKNAVSLLIAEITEFYRKHDTTEEEDTLLLSSLSAALSSSSHSGEPPNWNLLTAVTYRLVRKRILSSVIRGLNLVLVWITSFIIEREQQEQARAQGQGEESEAKETTFVEDVRRTLEPFYRFDTDGSLEEMVNYLSELRSFGLGPSSSESAAQGAESAVGDGA